MEAAKKHYHPALEERPVIQRGIIHGSTQTAIDKTTRKGSLTIGKEIKERRALTAKCNFPLAWDSWRKGALGREGGPKCPDHPSFTRKRRESCPAHAMGVPIETAVLSANTIMTRSKQSMTIVSHWLILARASI